MARSDRALVRPTLGLAAGALAALVMVACNALVGLSDFEKIECTNYRCPDDGGLEGSVAPEASAPDAQPDAPPGADPVSWARWKMPSWDGGPGPTPPAYTVQGAVVVDDVTGLVWSRTELGSVTFAKAKEACATLEGGPWRLPKRIELVTLLDFGRSPTISPVFEGAVQDKYWTSSEVRPLAVGGEPPRYWIVNFDTGRVTQQASTSSAVAFVRCVGAR